MSQRVTKISTKAAMAVVFFNSVLMALAPEEAGKLGVGLFTTECTVRPVPVWRPCHRAQARPVCKLSFLLP